MKRESERERKEGVVRKGRAWCEEYGGRYHQRWEAAVDGLRNESEREST